MPTLSQGLHDLSAALGDVSTVARQIRAREIEDAKHIAEMEYFSGRAKTPEAFNALFPNLGDEHRRAASIVINNQIGTAAGHAAAGAARLRAQELGMDAADPEALQAFYDDEASRFIDEKGYDRNNRAFMDGYMESYVPQRKQALAQGVERQLKAADDQLHTSLGTIAEHSAKNYRNDPKLYVENLSAQSDASKFIGQSQEEIEVPILSAMQGIAAEDPVFAVKALDEMIDHPTLLQTPERRTAAKVLRAQLIAAAEDGQTAEKIDDKAKLEAQGLLAQFGEATKGMSVEQRREVFNKYLDKASPYARRHLAEYGSSFINNLDSVSTMNSFTFNSVFDDVLYQRVDPAQIPWDQLDTDQTEKITALLNPQGRLPAIAKDSRVKAALAPILAQADILDARAGATVFGKTALGESMRQEFIGRVAAFQTKNDEEFQQKLDHLQLQFINRLQPPSTKAGSAPSPTNPNMSELGQFNANQAEFHRRRAAQAQQMDAEKHDSSVKRYLDQNSSLAPSPAVPGYSLDNDF